MSRIHVTIRLVIVLALSLAAGVSRGASTNPLFQNPLWWFGTPNPQPPIPIGDDVFTFAPLSGIQPFLSPLFGWLTTVNFESQVLGTSTVTVGPFGTMGSVQRVGETGELCLAVYKGELTLNLPDGQKLVIKDGQATILVRDNLSASQVVPISTLMSQPRYREIFMAAVKTAATSLANSSDGNNSEALTSAMAAVVQVVASADPTAAQFIIESAVGELTKGGKDSAATINAVATVIAAAANGSKLDANTLTTFAATTAGQNGAASINATSLASASTRDVLGGVFNAIQTPTMPVDINVNVSPSS